MKAIYEKYLRKEALPFIFCSGCGDGTVLNSFIRALDKLGIQKNDMGLASGIGCSSWCPVYLDFDVIHSLHGRAIACAEGLKIARPEKKVVVFTGDGDCAGIGGNHLIHAARRNIDITVIEISNFIYGMTGGQKAPTTPYGAKTKTSPLGNEENPFDLFKLVVGSGGTFFARWTSAHPIQMEKAFIDAINHKGFSFVEVFTQCPAQAGRSIFDIQRPDEMLSYFKENTYIVKEGQAPDEGNSKTPLGLLHVSQRKEFMESLREVEERGVDA